MKNKLCIIVPCYNEEETLSQSNQVLLNTLHDLVSKQKIDADSYILYVDDGSSDNTWEIICRIYNNNNRNVKGIKLSANKGHQNALLAGLENSYGNADIIVTIDADLQDDVNAIGEMVTKHCEGQFDIVYGVRNKRESDTWFKRNSALLFYKIMNVLGVKTVYNHADFRLMSSRAVKALCEYKENNLFLRGIIPLIGYKSCNVYYNRTIRKYGTTKYPLRKMMSFAIDGITSFSIQPVRMIMVLGFVFIAISIAILIYVLYQYCNHNVVSGWSSMILSIWFVGGCILASLGVIGEYIGKIFVEVKKRPRYHIESLLS